MQKPSSCIGCPYYDRTMVEGDGYAGAELIIIGQSPGKDEKEAGKPFVGASGQVLNRALRTAQISRNQNYVTNVVKCFVPAGERVEPEAIRKCKPLLEAELNQLPAAKTLLAVGAEAFNAISGKEIKFVHNRKSAEKNALSWLRGSPYKLGERTLIGTIHPSFVMRSGFLNAPTFEHDVVRAGKFAEGKLRFTEPTLLQNPSNRDAEEYIYQIIAQGEGGLDIETPELEVDEDEADAILNVPISEIGISAKIGESMLLKPQQFELLRPLLEGPKKTTLWTFGGGFDFMHLGKHWNLRGVNIADAMIAFYCLWPDLSSYDLATGQTYYATVPYYKNWRKLKPELYDTLGNCYDTFTAMEIGQRCLEEMRSKLINMEPFFWSLMPLIKAIEPWRTKGCRYDVEEGMKLLVRLETTLLAYEDWWRENLPNWQWSSPKQLIEMFTALGYKVPLRKRVKKDKSVLYTPSCDDEALISLAAKGAAVAPLIQTMRELKGAQDKLAISSPDGWVRTRAKIHGQAGGRLQLVNENLQQIPETMAGVECRSIIIGDEPEDLILQADFSQIEFFIYGSEPYANDPKIQEIQESGDYLYGYFYENIYHKPFFLEGKPRKKMFRHPGVSPAELLVVKSYPLGFTYGRSNIPSEYKWLYGWYHSQFTHIAPFHNELVFRAQSQGYLQTVFGRMRRFPNARGSRGEILAFPGQSSLPDVLFRNAVIPLTESLPRLFGPRSRPLFTVHDSVVCNIQGAAKSLQIARDAIEHVDATLQRRVPELGNRAFACESKIGPSWGEGYLAHKLEGWFNGRLAAQV